MKIIDYLDKTKQIRVSTDTIYIGISKLCCLDCAATIDAINGDAALSVVEELDEALETYLQETSEDHDDTPQNTTPKRKIIETRGAHLSEYNWPEPTFLKHYEKIRAMKATAKEKLAKEGQTKHLSGQSPTPVRIQYTQRALGPARALNLDDDVEQTLQPPLPPKKTRAVVAPNTQTIIEYHIQNIQRSPQTSSMINPQASSPQQQWSQQHQQQQHDYMPPPEFYPTMHQHHAALYMQYEQCFPYSYMPFPPTSYDDPAVQEAYAMQHQFLGKTHQAIYTPGFATHQHHAAPYMQYEQCFPYSYMPFPPTSYDDPAVQEAYAMQHQFFEKMHQAIYTPGLAMHHASQGGTTVVTPQQQHEHHQQGDQTKVHRPQQRDVSMGDTHPHHVQHNRGTPPSPYQQSAASTSPRNLDAELRDAATTPPKKGFTDREKSRENTPTTGRGGKGFL